MGYRLNGKGRSSVWGRCRKKQGSLQCGLPVQWIRKVFSVGNGRLEERGLQTGVPVEWNREIFSVGYLSNGKGRSSVWVIDRMEQGGVKCEVSLE